jgi:hypothetical protein
VHPACSTQDDVIDTCLNDADVSDAACGSRLMQIPLVAEWCRTSYLPAWARTPSTVAEQTIVRDTLLFVASYEREQSNRKMLDEWLLKTSLRPLMSSLVARRRPENKIIKEKSKRGCGTMRADEARQARLIPGAYSIRHSSIVHGRCSSVPLSGLSGIQLWC